jgi:hypothetical protein
MESIRLGSPLVVADVRRLVGVYVQHCNEKRLHSGIGYITAQDKLEGRAEVGLGGAASRIRHYRRWSL